MHTNISRPSALQVHLDVGKHKRAPERETFFDKPKRDYASMVVGERSQVPTIGCEDAESEDAASPSGCDRLQMGWALKVARKSNRFTTAQKKYLSQQFFIGKERGKKADPKEVALDMRQARDENGARIFVGKDLLSSQQIAGVFSRLATKVRKSSPSVEPYESEDESADQNNDQKAAEAATRLSDLHGLVEREVALRHPIVCFSHNICSLVHINKLLLLTVANLREILLGPGHKRGRT